jgi:hypothetical protein
MTLNFRHRLFIQYFLEDAKGDAVKAASLAGYNKPASTGPQLLANKTIAAYLERKLEEAGAMKPAEILARMSDVAAFDPTRFLTFTTEDKNGKTTEKVGFNIKGLKKSGLGHVIHKMDILPSGTVKLEFHDSMKAKEQLAKIGGMYKEQIEVKHIGDNIGNDRIIAILGGVAQLTGAYGAGAVCREPEPGRLCGGGEQWEVVARPALEVDQSTPDLDRPEGDRPPGDHPGPANGQERVDLEILPGLDDRPEAE